MGYYHRFCNLIQKVLNVIVVIIVAVMLILMLTEVVRRYLFSQTWIWSDETIRILLIYTAFLGGATAYGCGRMINFDMIYTKFPPKILALANIFIFVVSQLFILFVLILSIKKLLNPSMTAQVSVNTGLPIGVTYFCIPISMACCLMFGIDQIPSLLRTTRELLGKHTTEEGGDLK